MPILDFIFFPRFVFAHFAGRAWLLAGRPRADCYIEELFPMKFMIQFFVIPAKAGIQSSSVVWTSGKDWTPDVRSGVTKSVHELDWKGEQTKNEEARP